MVLSSVSSDWTSRPSQTNSGFTATQPVTLHSADWEPLVLPATKLFGTDGIRGQVDDLLSVPLALQVGFWAGRVLQATTAKPGLIILGQDSRNSSPMLATALSTGLTAAGLEVWNLGLCPTPTVAFLTSTSEAIGGVMISASHNPPEDNGIKFFAANGTKLSPQLQTQIESALRGEGGWASQQKQLAFQPGQHYHRPELVKAYVESLQQPLIPHGNLTGMRIVLDLAWGAAAQLAPAVFEAMGADVICLHDYPDGDRINVNCGSTHLASLKAAVQEHDADLGVAFDGDADRAMAVDAQGRVVDGDYILYFWGETLRQQNRLPGNTIVSTVMANLGFERAWERQGGKLIRTAVGDQYVHAEMVKHGYMLGGEQSGHILCPHYSVSGDGLLTALHLATIVRQSGVSLVEMVDQSFQTYPQLLRNVRVEDRDRRLNWKENARLQQAIAQAEAEMGDRGRILVRASGTEPVIRVMVEAADAELVQHWTDKLVLAVQQYAA
ncbi:phosphoglucosamine mutase [Leptolyngbya sp. FACHB-541]|uniref:phosphoglucosamine mutase n=1 Tax=Leptolyngbya sp. FACHB-541 TaxID=2692810 RepID=UPI001688B13B|nr:phosphoglucosamine mutase [Leptolyngbya sp. FACHB-541]MBD1996670.1 phosphoglucosamine mutase [Leptolyngbya sp. FACHB-541]